MNTQTPLRDLDYISMYVLYISLLCLAISAYKRTKQKGFVFLIFSALGSLLTAPLPFQPSRSRPSGNGNSALIFEATHCVHLASNILMLVGIALSIQGYVAIHNQRSRAGANPSEGHGGSGT
jgi:hypothetical protein